MDLYAALGVSKKATPEEIKQSYRRLALQFHPDRNPGDTEAEKRFKEVAAAYEVLGDPSKRSLYDLQGYVGRRPPPPPPPPKEPKKPKPPPPHNPIFDREPSWDDHWDNPVEPSKEQLDGIHCMFFGGESSGRSILVHLPLTREQLRHGCQTTVTIKRRKLCQVCAGEGVSYEKCPRCGGNWEATRMSVWNAPDTCPECHDGNGGLISGKQHSCHRCGGDGMGLWEIRDVPIRVPPGSRVGHRLSFSEGEDGPKGRMPGFLHVTLLEK